MPSLDETFDGLLEHLRHPDFLNPARSDPFFYFIHSPSETLQVKQKLSVWTSVLRNDGWNVEVVSLATLLWRIVENSGRWDEWLSFEQNADRQDVNDAVSDVLRSGNSLVRAVSDCVSSARPHTIVFLTDACALHPYFRARALEAGLHDNIKVPTVLFYPGRRSGQYGLHFLGFYPFDGNYRSTLLGGLE
jgi:BREX protein BrxB